MKILVSNDDGIQSPGIEAIVKALSLRHEVIVAAPSTQQSAKSQALTVQQKLYVDNYAPFQEKYGLTALSIGGTPADCVKLYLEGLAEEMPDLVISGINNGSNLGTDILYSGTLGAAREGFIHNIPSIGLSLDYDSELTFDFVAKEFVKHMKEILALSKENQLLNINFPKKLKEGYQWVWAKQGKRDYANAFVPHKDSDGRRYYYVAGDILDEGNDELTDIVLGNSGNVTVTPILADMTDYTFVREKLGQKVL